MRVLLSFASSLRSVARFIDRAVNRSQRPIPPIRFYCWALAFDQRLGRQRPRALYFAFTDPLGLGQGGDKALQRRAARRGRLSEERRRARHSGSLVQTHDLAHRARDMPIFNQFRPRLKRASHRSSLWQRRAENRRGHHLLLIVCCAAKTKRGSMTPPATACAMDVSQSRQLKT